MTYLIAEIAVLLLIAFLIGLLIGWWFFRNRNSGTQTDDSALQARIARLEAELGECGADKVRLRAELQECRAANESQQSFAAAAPLAAQEEARPPADDLKRISGIGPILEGKLNAIDVWRFEQIANWTRADIDAFNQRLNFKGRIEREFWVDQAKMLAEGKETDFSKRYDDGEIE